MSSGSVNADCRRVRGGPAITTSWTRECPQRGQRVVGDVGAGQRVRVGRQDARDVERDVAVADDDHPLMAQIDWQIGVFGMPVDPRHHFGGGAGTRQPHAVDVESTVVGRTDGVEHRVVVRQQVVMRQVRSHLDVEVEP